MDKKQKQIIKISVFITSIFVILLSVTYAFINVQLTGTKKQVITAGTLDLELQEENEITITDALPMYDEVGMIQEDVFVFRLINKTANATNYVLKLQEIQTGTLDKTIVKYGLIKEGEPTIDYVSNITDGIIDEGTITGNDTLDYELRLWIDSKVTQMTEIQNKFLSFRVAVDASQVTDEDEQSGEPVTSKVFAEENLGENCTTYDDGTDTFLVGQCSQNYVWYSGKLWRVVLKNNETGAVKMITDNNITEIDYDYSDTAFENSYADQWLNQDFLPTLHDASSYLVTDYVWDATLDANDTPSRPAGTTTVARTVGLLNAYEYYTTYNNSDGLATYSTGYLNSGVHWWLITPYSPSYVWGVSNSSYLGSTAINYGYGLRPSINLKSTIPTVSGSGSQSDPYILKGDVQETVAGTTLLSTRYSGEYVTFNNELYRIVGVENGLTKITAVDKPSSLAKIVFNTTTAYGTSKFANSTIKTDLETYYQELATTNSSAYNMIEPNTTWYLGMVANSRNYKLSICATANTNISTLDCTKTTTTTTASIALPRVGEMFTTQITRGTKAAFWTLTPYDSYNVRYTSGGRIGSQSPDTSYGARPSMYLKSNVVIANDNTGNGTYEYPYSIELGA